MTETPRSDLSFLSLSTLYNNARRAHPAFKFFTVVAGMAAIVITVTRYGVNSATLVFGIIILIILAVVFLVFVQASALKGKHLTLPAIILVYSALTLVIATATMLFLAAFFNVGLPLRDRIITTVKPPTPEMSSEEAYKLGLQLQVGQSPNYTEAFKYFTIAANQGHPAALGSLGWLYELGLVPTGPDCVRAMQLYREAYAKGAINSSWNIGRLYDTACGVPQNNHLARCWYEKAKTNGLSEATRDLSTMKEQGRLDSDPCPSL